MRLSSLCSLVVSGLGVGLASLNATASPLVIPGIGPEEAQQIMSESSRRRGARPAAGPAEVAPAPVAPTRVAAAPAPNYGGGFIELLMTGRDPTPRGGVVYNTPTAAPQVYSAPMRAAREPRYQQVNLAPEQHARALREPDARYARQEVDYDGQHAPGTIVVDTPNKYLYLVTGSGRAVRYGIGVGRPGFEWSGVKTISRKAEWPDWTPPPEMLKRRPDLPRHMAGGPENPLGARAMYLGSSLYRIHGTNEPHTIGQNVSSGCIRMMNSDVEDLYGRVRVGTKVIVI